MTTREEQVRLQEAADWVQRLEACETPPVEALLEWCDDARNLAALEGMGRLWAAADAVPLPLTASPPATVARRWPRVLGAALAAAAVVAALVLWLMPSRGAQVYATGRGETRSWRLVDGSEIDLAPRSRVEVRFIRATRALRLVQGQAYFTVHHDAHRPFVVQASDLSVTAVGTAFDVRVGARAVVSVGEGRVQIVAQPPGGAPAALPPFSVDAGQQFSLERDAAQPRILPIDTRAAGSWRRGALQFDGESLAAIAETLNEYGGRPVRVEGAAQAQRFTGTVAMDRLDDWLQALEVIYAVRVVHEGNQIVIQPRAGRAHP